MRGYSSGSGPERRTKGRCDRQNHNTLGNAVLSGVFTSLANHFSILARHTFNCISMEAGRTASITYTSLMQRRQVGRADCDPLHYCICSANQRSCQTQIFLKLNPDPEPSPLNHGHSSILSNRTRRCPLRSAWQTVCCSSQSVTAAQARA